MNPMTLYIGSKRPSSWSLRPWLLMRHHEFAFAESLFTLDSPGSRTRNRPHSPRRRVPALVAGEIPLWESLAIFEYPDEHCALPSASTLTAAHQHTLKTGKMMSCWCG